MAKSRGGNSVASGSWVGLGGVVSENVIRTPLKAQKVLNLEAPQMPTWHNVICYKNKHK